MTREEWKAFTHSIRADARAFLDIHGGFPCFTRHFHHNSEEWSLTRSRQDGVRWTTNLRKSLIRQRAWRGLSARALNECREYHADYKSGWKSKLTARRAIRISVAEAKAWREAAA